MKNKNVAFMTQAAMIAAIYVVLTYVFAPFSFGEVQIRIAEALTILPVFTPAAIPGLFVGCIVGNILGGAILPDIIFGSIATLIGAFFTYQLRNKNRFLAPLPPIIANTVIVPFVLRYGYGVALPIPFMMLTVGIDRVLAVKHGTSRFGVKGHCFTCLICGQKRNLWLEKGKWFVEAYCATSEGRAS